MTQWPSTKARRVYAALLSVGWQMKRQSGSHRTLARSGYADFVFAFHDSEEIGPSWNGRNCQASLVRSLGAPVDTSLTMPIDIRAAHQLALDAIAGDFRDSVELTPIESLPGPAYRFEPSGWLLFSVHRRNVPPFVGPGEYVAIHSESGEFRHVRFIGE